MEYLEAIKIAKKYLELLSPHCERIEIAGSLRRKKREVHDIEFICIPKKVYEQTGLFDGKYVASPEFCSVVNSLERIKGNPEGKYCARRLPEGINLDIFIVTAEYWGYQMALRTGPATFSKYAIVRSAKKVGFTLKDGKVYGIRGPIPMPDEKEFFKRIKLDWVNPEYRVM